MYSFHLPNFYQQLIFFQVWNISSVLAWRIPGMGEAGGLLSMGSHRVRHDWSDLAAAAAVAAAVTEISVSSVY